MEVNTKGTAIHISERKISVMEKTFSLNAYANHLQKELTLSFAGADLATTPGLVGSAKEHPVRMALRALLPPGISLGSGCVIDSHGGTSRQIDVVLYETGICPCFSINDTPETTYYPCEGVVAVGEVKSSLGSNELEDIFRKIESVKQLRRFSDKHYRSYGTKEAVENYITGSPDYSQEDNSLNQIFGFALVGKLKLLPQTFCAKFASRARETEPVLTPNLIVMLKGGILCPATFSGQQEESEMKISLQDSDDMYYVDRGDENFSFLLSRIYDVFDQGRTVSTSAFGRYFAHDVTRLPPGGTRIPIEKQGTEPESKE